MWFKNIQLFKVHGSLPTAEQLEESLQEQRLQACPRSQTASQGWVSPYGRHEQQLVHACMGNLLFGFGKEERLLPATVIRDELEDRVHEMEQRQERKLFPRERRRMREELAFELLPKAFVRRKSLLAYLDVEAGYLFVDSSSANMAEELASLLVKCCTTLQLTRVPLARKPMNMMTGFLLGNQQDEAFETEQECELIHPDREKSLVRVKGQVLNVNEVLSWLKIGYKVSKLALNWQGRISLLLHEDLTLSRIRYIEELEDSHSQAELTEMEQLDANFALMGMVFRELIGELLVFLGGLETAEITESAGVEEVVY